ncbi:hypothetical protein CRUP_038433, partial [Coryphaenoides rupestris]
MSISAFAPICNPIQCPWGQKAFSGYLGADKSIWEAYDATVLAASYESPQLDILIDQGSSSQLLPDHLIAACSAKKIPATNRSTRQKTCIRLEPIRSHICQAWGGVWVVAQTNEGPFFDRGAGLEEGSRGGFRAAMLSCLASPGRGGGVVSKATSACTVERSGRKRHWVMSYGCSLLLRHQGDITADSRQQDEPGGVFVTGQLVERGGNLPRLFMPPSSWLRGVSLREGGACERRGRRQEGGGEQGSEGGAKNQEVQEETCGGAWRQEGEMSSPSCERMMFSTPPFGLKPRSVSYWLPGCSLLLRHQGDITADSRQQDEP